MKFFGVKRSKWLGLEQALHADYIGSELSKQWPLTRRQSPPYCPACDGYDVIVTVNGNRPCALCGGSERRAGKFHPEASLKALSDRKI